MRAYLLLTIGLLALPAVSMADLAQEARGILKSRCYSCHGEAGANEGGFNFALNRKRLVRELVVPGDANESKLFQRVVKGEMPDGGPPLDKAEVETLRKWITADAPAFGAEATPEFVSPLAMIAAMVKDLHAAIDRDRPFLRYFTLTHLYNAGFEDNELETHRQGLSKLLNSLSWGREVRPPTPIDEHKTILRIDLRHYKWNESNGWVHLIAADPYRVTYSDPQAKTCYDLTQCEQPYVRADWFVFAGARPPLYNKILALPETAEQFVKFEKERLGVDVAQNLRDYNDVLRAGFFPSGVSQSNRLIERHVSSYGAYWKSYDFKPVDPTARTVRRANLKAHPTGPGGKNGFEHDGGEMIFSLPNGLQAYMLTDAVGKQIPKGPTDVVLDKEAVKRGRNADVINGVSCMNCHWSGMLKKTDQIRDHVLKQAGAFDYDVVEFVKAVYADKPTLDAKLKEDRDRFEAAVKKCGLTSLAKSEPVATLAFQFDEPLDVDLAAAEAGVKPADLVIALKQSAVLGRELGSLPQGQPVQRETYVANFGTLIQQLKIGQFIARFESDPDFTQGIAFAWGLGVKINERLAFEHFLKSANQNNPLAMAFLARGYQQGYLGIARDKAEAERWIQRSHSRVEALASSGNPLAQYLMGQAHFFAMGVPENYPLSVSWFQKAAEQNLAVAQSNLGFSYSNGTGVTKDPIEAVKWYRKAADQNLAAGQRNLARMYQSGTGVPKDPTEAVKWLRKAAEQDHPVAQTDLGAAYANGTGIAKDPVEAIVWYRKAAEQNEPFAQNNLGQAYASGIGVTKDAVEAVQWYRKAAEQENAFAQANLGFMYEKGQGVALDAAEAVKWYRKAADQGNAYAQGNLAVCLENGFGVAKDPVAAVKLYRQAADKESAFAYHRLGLCCQAGIGVPKEPAEAVKWFRKASELNHAPSQTSLGFAYDTGNGVAKDEAEAVKWYRKASEQNDEWGQNNLGTMYENGTGVAKDHVEALKWYRKAAEQQNAAACNNVGRMYVSGNGVAKDPAEGAKWYRKGADKGNAVAATNLGVLYEQGTGVTKDAAEANNWYRKAADQNHALAQYYLGLNYAKGIGVTSDATTAAKWHRLAANNPNASADIKKRAQEALDCPPALDATRDRTAAEVLAAQEAWAKHRGLKVEITNSIGQTLRLVPPGAFMTLTLGGDQNPAQRATLDNPFYVSVTEVTQGQWTALMGTTPWSGKDFIMEGANYPATYVNQPDALAFLEKLNKKENKGIYRLPYEIEWEYACRAGTTTSWAFGEIDTRLNDYGWHRKNSFDLGEKYAHQVGLKLPNAFGLKDMHGNVSEWCSESASEGKQSLRGGNWNYTATYNRSATRLECKKDIRSYDKGFRVVAYFPP